MRLCGPRFIAFMQLCARKATIMIVSGIIVFSSYERGHAVYARQLCHLISQTTGPKVTIISMVVGAVIGEIIDSIIDYCVW